MKWSDVCRVTYVVCLATLRLCVGERGPSYVIPCTADTQCTAAATACFKDYVGCDVGTCGCRYGTRHDGTCVNKLEENGCSCTSDEHCGRGLECIRQQCTCPGTMIDSGAYCLKPYELVVGSLCGSGQICVHRKEGSDIFVSTEVSCHNMVCQCRQGLTQDRWTCRRFRPGEYGCYTNADCSGDSVCDDTRHCACPAGHREVTAGKCGKSNARTHLQHGTTCDEILDKDRFCSPGLECVKCGEFSTFKCREYRSSRMQSTCSGQSTVHRKRMTSLLTILFILLNYCL